jgi:hypothetical protein
MGRGMGISVTQSLKKELYFQTKYYIYNTYGQKTVPRGYQTCRCCCCRDCHLPVSLLLWFPSLPQCCCCPQLWLPLLIMQTSGHAYRHGGGHVHCVCVQAGRQMCESAACRCTYVQAGGRVGRYADRHVCRCVGCGRVGVRVCRRVCGCAGGCAGMWACGQACRRAGMCVCMQAYLYVMVTIAPAAITIVSWLPPLLCHGCHCYRTMPTQH